MKTTQVDRVTQSPLNKSRWCIELSCGHEIWVTAARRPTVGKPCRCTACAGVPTVRAKLLSFAVIMQEKLDDNAHKGGWANETPKQLLKRAKQELRELEAAVNNTYQSEDDIAREAADVANFCMMIADVCGGLK